jgi:glycine dehydrogenase
MRLGRGLPGALHRPSGRVAHECILDLRPLTKASGITVDDVAKRLIDYGFHAPTMSFRWPGTLMVEPTESENLAELDRFCAAMIAIREEIAKVEAGEWPADDNPLVNAPHTQSQVTDDEWDHPYSRRLAAFPAGLHLGPLYATGADKYWPPVGGSTVASATGTWSAPAHHRRPSPDCRLSLSKFALRQAQGT